MSLWGRLKAWWGPVPLPACRICGDTDLQTEKIEYASGKITVWVKRCGFCGLSTTEVT